MAAQAWVKRAAVVRLVEACPCIAALSPGGSADLSIPPIVCTMERAAHLPPLLLTLPTGYAPRFNFPILRRAWYSGKRAASCTTIQTQRACSSCTEPARTSTYRCVDAIYCARSQAVCAYSRQWPALPAPHCCTPLSSSACFALPGPANWQLLSCHTRWPLDSLWTRPTVLQPLS